MDKSRSLFQVLLKYIIGHAPEDGIAPEVPRMVEALARPDSRRILGTLGDRLTKTMATLYVFHSFGPDLSVGALNKRMQPLVSDVLWSNFCCSLPSQTELAQLGCALPPHPTPPMLVNPPTNSPSSMSPHQAFAQWLVDTIPGGGGQRPKKSLCT